MGFCARFGIDESAASNPVDAPLPWRTLFSYGWQHVLVMVAGTVTVPLIFGAAMNLSARQLIELINADLFTCGLATLLQSVGIWRFGARTLGARLFLHSLAGYGSHRQSIRFG